MRELDVVLTRYLDTRYAQADVAEKQAFVTLLALSDPELVRYLLHGESSGQADLDALFSFLRR